jgi:hypothetical protein
MSKRGSVNMSGFWSAMPTTSAGAAAGAARATAHAAITSRTTRFIP